MNAVAVRLVHTLVIGLFVVILHGCAALQTGLEAPQLRLISLALLPAEPNSLEQRFALGVRVTNPNVQNLNPIGLSYGLTLLGHDVISGVANDVPEIPAFGEVELELVASLNLFAGARMLMELMSKQHQAIDYSLSAKIALNSWAPAIRVVESGTIRLDSAR